MSRQKAGKYTRCSTDANRHTAKSTIAGSGFESRRAHKRTGPVPGNLKQNIMAKCKVKPDNETFHFSNLNPKQESTGDCVIRAVAAFLGISWESAYRQLAEWGIEHATAIDCPENYGPFLLDKGFGKERMPRREDRTKYTAEEFCKEIAQPGCVYILSLANHLAFVGPDQRIWDTWDCGFKSVGNYWIGTTK